ncbi:hypothetical protein CCUG60884_04355 [Mycobacteroides salmoniphilum]|uniref:Uncharacterized protein n=1 Tax=Mycobacteroides salmoniphilum TaxID=404941 RepID=A0A4R8SN59_9MYCO|nr:hypothetical protein CCUG60884_04355 [Mycobacteroides salmoniphilum]
MDEWAYGGKTDMLALTFGCARHHELLGPSTITGGPYAALTATPEGVVRHRPRRVNPTGPMGPRGLHQAACLSRRDYSGMVRT